VGQILRLAREAGVPVTRLPRAVLARKIGSEAGHQGLAARLGELPYADADAVCAAALADPVGMLLLLDRVVDPQNLGSVLRVGAAAGVSGVLLAGEGTVGLTPAVGKASAGAWLKVPVAREPRPARRLASLRGAGFRAVALDPRAALSWDRADLTGRIIIVAGGEEKGSRPSVLEACDLRLAIPLAAGVESLNVAVATSVLLFEAVRQRRQAGSGP
jgi:23S rRNA (guanosine2251-2'-O)-methyltransferase